MTWERVEDVSVHRQEKQVRRIGAKRSRDI